MLDSTRNLLNERGYRGLRVADIARQAGTSPATFYTYFADVEAAIYTLMTTVVAEADTRLRQPIENSEWTPDNVEAHARALAEEFLHFWADHHELISVVDLRAAEGAGALKDVRGQLLRGVSNALESTYESRVHVDAKGRAFVLVAMLANVAAHQHGMIAAGVSRDELVASLTKQMAYGF